MEWNVFGARYSNDTVSWQDEPANRSTFSILTICLITLVLCTWGNIHLGLPAHAVSSAPTEMMPRGNSASIRSLQAQWVFLSVFFPEVLVYEALMQFRRAKNLCAQARAALNSKTNSGDAEQAQLPTSRHQWTMTHSYWAMLGGIVAGVPDIDTFLPVLEDKNVVFEANGVSLLLRFEPDIVPDVAKSELKKSWWTFSAIFRVFVCVQSLWFCIAFIGRLAQRHVLSQLEAVIFLHALCTLVIYALLWQKGFVNTRVTRGITDERVRPFVAYSWMASDLSARPQPPPHWDSNIKESVAKTPEFEAIRMDRRQGDSQLEQQLPTLPAANSPAPDTDGLSVISATQTLTEDAVLPPPAPVPATPTNVRVTPTDALPGTGFYVNPNSQRWIVKVATTTETQGSEGPEFRTEHTTYNSAAAFDLSPVDVARWKLAWEAFVKYSQLPRYNADLKLISVRVKGAKRLPYPTIHHGDCNSWQVNKACGTDFTEVPEMLTGVFLSGLFGGFLAMAGWKATFPDETEALLWKIASLVTAGVPGAFLVASVAIGIWRFAREGISAAQKKRRQDCAAATEKAKKGERWKKVLASKWLTIPGKMLLGITYMVVGLAWMCIYLPSKVYLVWEGFRTMGCLPPEAYEVARWVNYLPHASWS
ncbi:hypothetical protein QBC35DRAFT_503979 [Podospora australis]|uniref:Uncharacterized protein n=1 Tax=Podospora australis TaxID=1536484 RepID=A0AAN6WQ06_9PEZI|nr:hypothetical protein QBC35DRAFT_503979 [Podospora australis]